MSCSFCDGKLIELPNGLYKCVMCGTYQEFRRDGIQRAAVLRTYPYSDVINEAAVEGVVELSYGSKTSSNVDPDIAVFIDRLSKALTDTEGLDRAARGRALGVRADFKDQLYEVFEGDRSWQEWYDSTRTQLGMHNKNFMAMIYECLDGLESEEAVAMRNAYAQALSGGIGV
jgi:hypothetical protein